MTELNVNQGLFANQSGNTLEFIITSTLNNKGFKVVSYRDFVKMPIKYGNEVLLKGVPYTTVYNHPGKTELSTGPNVMTNNKHYINTAQCSLSAVTKYGHQVLGVEGGR